MLYQAVIVFTKTLVQVRFAKSHQFVQAGTGPDDNRQLFFSNAPAAFSEEDLSTFFSAFGAVEELNLFRERKTGNSKGSGFVTMATREQALRALESLEDTSGEVGASHCPPAGGFEAEAPA
jgi:phosphoinositide-3-kinase regulatory subunit 4